MSNASNHDLQLAFEAKEILRTLAGRLPSWLELEAIREEQGFEIAQAVFYRSILQSQPHSGFIRHVQTIKPGFHDHSEGKSPIEVVIVPSTMPGAAVWGAHVEWMRKNAREMGFTTEVIDTDKKDSVAGNAWRIGEHLKSTKAERILMVTTGRGSAELRMYLQRRGKNAVEPKKIRGWLNINGCAHGSRLFEDRMQSKLRRIGSQLTSTLLGKKDFTVASELATSFPLWREQLAVHQKLMTVSVFGLILPNQVPVGGREAFATLEKLGVNDGCVLAREAIIRPGMLYPIQGMSHALDETIFQGHLQRLLTCMGQAIVRDDPTLKKIDCPVVEASV